MGRVNERLGMTPELRMTLLETDLDRIDERFDELEARLDVMQRLMISLLVGITLAAVTGIANLIH